jgi:hypothetical protein
MFSMDDIFFSVRNPRTHNTLLTHPTSTHSNTADHIYIYHYWPSVLPPTQVQMHAYGLNYLSPYKTHSSISAPEVGHSVF